MPDTRNTFIRKWWPVPVIGAIAGSLLLAFAWSAGWVGDRVTAKAFVNASPTFPPGFRRAHGKGLCYAATFRPTEAGRALSRARAFSQAEVPVVGRFSVGSGNPFATDDSSKVISMALLMTTDDQQQWRMAMNNQPFFATHDAEGFLALQKATAPDPATGKPDPERLAQFLTQYPEAKKFLERARQAPAPGSYAGVNFNGINAFYLTSEHGNRVPVRWSLRAHDSFKERDPQAGPDYLFQDLKDKLANTPLYWDFVLQVAQPGDPVDDPSQPWPEDRQHVVAGTVEVTAVSDQATGACRDVNFDPTILPAGVEVSNDPILSARSAAYSRSFNQREREIGYGQATEAVGRPVEPRSVP
ncbi:catalase [Pseudomonas sp. Leaf127]|uniref:catalase family peroxidase n=1 Tax=Pseudomonas sp. Leaf127 TaxID=1736267 RepID=UPI000702CC91|nr:catalase family peroxidase [Pseudomonas sp. Leaf127]KQQ60217.1 catalase [Pseudomonas sp. Leaf127]